MNFPRSSMTPVNCPLSCRSFTRSTASYRECKVPKCKIKLTVELLLLIKFFFLNQINQYQSSKFLFPSHLQLSYNELSVYKSCWHCWFVSDFGGEEEGRGTASLFQYTNCFTCTCMYTLVFQSDINELSPNIFLLNLPFHRVLLNWSQFTGHNIDKPTPKRNSWTSYNASLQHLSLLYFLVIYWNLIS